MPGGSIPNALPLSALFAVYKPAGPTSMSVINQIKPLLQRSRLFMAPENLRFSNKQLKKRAWKRKPKVADLKIGQGGTLDPLASGVLVIGVGKGTKALGQFLECDKVYETTMLLGSATDSYDSEGSIVRHAPWSHITKQMVLDVLPRFSGDIEQVPPIYSALKMDGKSLYEYARKGLPLPRPIEKRPVRIKSIGLLGFTRAQSQSSEVSADTNDISLPDGHKYLTPTNEFTKEEREKLRRMLQSTAGSGSPSPSIDPVLQLESTKDPVYPKMIPPTIKIRVSCSGGTYIRSLAHDIGLALGSAAHVVQLERIKQGEWGVERAVPWEIFSKALENDGTTDGTAGSERDPLTRMWYEWEEVVLDKMEVIADEKIHREEEASLVEDPEEKLRTLISTDQEAVATQLEFLKGEAGKPNGKDIAGTDEPTMDDKMAEGRGKMELQQEGTTSELKRRREEIEGDDDEMPPTKSAKVDD